MSITTLKTLATFDPYWEAQSCSETYNKRVLFIVQKIAIALQTIGLIGLISLQFLSSPIWSGITAGFALSGAVSAIACSFWPTEPSFRGYAFPGLERVFEITWRVNLVFIDLSAFLISLSSLLATRVYYFPHPVIPIAIAVLCTYGAWVFGVETRSHFSQLSVVLTHPTTAI